MAPPDAPEGAPSQDPIADLRTERAHLMRQCTPKQRKWIKKLPEYSYHYYSRRLIKALGISSHTVQTWLLKPHIQRMLAIVKEIGIAQYGLDDAFYLARQHSIATVSVADYFNETWTDLKPKGEWTQDMHDALRSLSYDKVGRPQIELYSRRDALNDIAKYKALGSPDRVDVRANISGAVALARQGVSDMNATTDPNEASRIYSEMLTSGKRN